MIKRPRICQRITERKSAERNMIRFTNEEKIQNKYEIFIFNS